MASFLLVHGSWHGAWCWEEVVPRLRDAGHEAIAIDLPAHGEDRTSPWRVTQASYARAVLRSTARTSRRPIVVGHSMAGMSITRAALTDPGRFAALIYVAAFVPLAGETLLGLGARDRASLVLESTRPGLRGARVRPEKARALFYGCCDPDVAARAAARLGPDPIAPALQPLPRGGPPDVPRGYVECTEDRTISIERQRAMSERIRFDARATIETDHSPFLSTPDRFVGILDEMATLAD